MTRAAQFAASPGARRALGSALFAASSIAVGAAAFVALAVLAHSGVPGDLAAASAVISLSLVLAVVPGAIQLRAAAQVAATDSTPDAAAGAGAPRAGVPMAFLGWSSALLLAASPLVAALLAVPALSLALLVAQYAAASVASAQRGLAIGRDDHLRASESMAVEASVRLLAGVPLGITLGPTGLALGLLLGSVAAALAGRRWAGPLQSTSARAVLGPALSVGLLMLLVNLDAFAVPRLLGAEAADAYAVAELPARGAFFALFALSWLAVPVAARADGVPALVRPIARVLALGAAVTLTLLGVRPLLPLALGDPAPAAVLLVTLVAAMILAATLATAVAMAAARSASHPWAPTLAATTALAAALLLLPGAPTPERVASLLLAATAAALVATTGLLLRTAPRSHRIVGTPHLARR